MKLSNLIWPLAVILFLATPTLLTETEPDVSCDSIEYIQRGRFQTLVVCTDTVYDTGTAFRHEAFQDTIQQVRSQL